MSGHQVEITTESIRELATTRLSAVIKEVATAKSKFLSIPGGWNESACWASVFGDTEEGRELERAHRDALEVFLTAAELIEHQLQDMQTGLLEVLASYEETDASAEEVLRRYLTDFGKAVDASDDTLAGTPRVATTRAEVAVGEVARAPRTLGAGQTSSPDDAGDRVFENE